jgi:hypothetical protein
MIVDPLLARSPAAFLQSTNIVQSGELNGMSFSLTNRGLHLQLRTKYLANRQRRIIGVLDCREEGQLVGISLEEHHRDESYCRPHGDQLETVTSSELGALERKSLYGLVTRSQIIQDKSPDYDKCFIRTAGLQSYGISITETVPPRDLISLDGQLSFGMSPDNEVIGAIQFAVYGKETWAVVLRLAEKGYVSANIVEIFEGENLWDIVESFKPATIYARIWEDTKAGGFKNRPF